MGSRMDRPASSGWRNTARVLCCQDCHECLNARWYYPSEIFLEGHGRTKNPFQARCRNCGSTRFVVGEIAVIDMQKWERKDNWQFIPYHDPTDLEIENPMVKRNIFEVRDNHVNANR